jgi:GH15 family glucan-1,4-alpha-glucosidase
MTHLINRSIEIIRANQHASGAYVASPNFPTYRYCWFRDGAFTAYAMDLAGEHESARRFHDWAAHAIQRLTPAIRRAVAKGRLGQRLELDYLPTRFTLDGEVDASSDWPNFQLDGFGTWLWALAEHMRLSGMTQLRESWQEASDLLAEYLSALWRYPCYDCWEEFPEHVHPYTLAAIFAGLNAHTGMRAADHQADLEAIKAVLLMNASQLGYFTKLAGSPAVDASLLGLAVPYAVVTPNDPIMLATAAQIEDTLMRNGGLHRYAADTYYGGGEWLLLTAWLGWYWCEIARLEAGMTPSALEKARLALAWVESQAGDGNQAGWLPEQVARNLNDPSYYPIWLARWGEIANPLLWSHAKHIILSRHLEGEV